VNFTPYFAWAGAEICVAVICIGIPTLRPLYLRTRGMSIGYANRSRSQASELPQFTMCDAKPIVDPYVRDSASSQAPLKGDVESTGSPARPPTAHTREAGDSIDGIVNLYDQAPNSGVIWVKNEVQVRIEREDANWPLKK